MLVNSIKGYGYEACPVPNMVQGPFVFLAKRLGLKLHRNSFIDEEACMEARGSKQETRVSRIFRQVSTRCAKRLRGEYELQQR